MNKLNNNKYIVTKHLCCKCGSNLILINDNVIYDGDLAQCDLCNIDIPRNESFFHCKENNIPQHKYGYDLCKKCVLTNENIQNNINKQQNKIKDEQEILLICSKQEKIQKKDEKKKIKNNRNEIIEKIKKKKDLLLKENNSKNNKIKYLQNQLEIIQKDKLTNDTTLKLVKNQVNELILKNEEINNKLIIQQKQNTKLQPNGQYKLLIELQTNFKIFKKNQLKQNKQIDENKNKIKKIEEILANMYQVFNNKFEKINELNHQNECDIFDSQSV